MDKILQERRDYKLIGMVLLAVLIFVFPLLRPRVFYLNVMNFIALHSMVALGLSLLFGYAGQISMGQAGFYGLGAYISAIFTTRFGFSPWLVMIAAAIFPMILAFIVGKPILRLRGLSLALATLAVGSALEVLFTQLPITGKMVGIYDIPVLTIGDIAFDTPKNFYFLAWAFTLALFFFSVNLVNSREGRALQAIDGSETAAAASGINIGLIKLKIFMISAFYAGLAGSLHAHYITFVSPETFSVNYSILLIVMLVIGGQRSVVGALLGATFFTVVPEIFRWSQTYNQLILGISLILVMLFMPNGIAGILEGGIKRVLKRKIDPKLTRVDEAEQPSC